MDLGGEFCLICGAGPPLFTDRMCEKCTRDRVTLAKVPKNVPWTKCARCGIVDFQGKWTDVDDDDKFDHNTKKATFMSVTHSRKKCYVSFYECI